MSLKIKSATEVPDYNCAEHLHWEIAVILLITLVKISPVQVCCYRVGHLKIFFDLQTVKDGKEAIRVKDF